MLAKKVEVPKKIEPPKKQPIEAQPDLSKLESMLDEVPGEDGFGDSDLSKFTSMLDEVPGDEGFGDTPDLSI